MCEIKELSPSGIDHLIHSEGLRLKPYLDTVGIPTIGVGNTYYPDGRRVTMKDRPLTLAEAKGMFKTIVKQYEMAVWSLTRDDITQNQFDALVSFSYNVGITAFKNSTLLKRINARASAKDIESAFMMWRKPAEIIGRRKREVALYLKP